MKAFPGFRSIVIAVLVAVVLVAGGLPGRVRAQQVHPSTFLGGGCDDDVWNPVGVPALPFLAPTHRSATWAGTKILIWGAASQFEAGYIYDPGGVGGWVEMAVQNQPTPNLWFKTFWTGSVMLVFGASNLGGQTVGVAGRYNPLNDTWSGISAFGAEPNITNYAGVWTGDHILMFSAAGGGVYDPGLDQWSSMNAQGMPILSAANSITAVWTGTEAIFVGSQVVQGVTVPAGGRYNPATDTWRPISEAGAPQVSHGLQAVWTGLHLLLWSDDGIQGKYDPAADKWSLIAPINLPSSQSVPTAEIVVWTGTEMLVWGQIGSNHGARYDPETDNWRTVSTAQAPPAGDYVGLWSSGLMFVIGTSTATPAGQPPTLFSGLYCSNAPPGCSYALSPGSLAFGASGGASSFSVNATVGVCDWAATSNAPWITLLEGTGRGNGTVDFSVAPNTDAASRSGTVTLSGQTFTITQAGGPHISGVSLDGKNLIVTGSNFDPASIVLVSGVATGKTLHDAQNPTTIIGKKGLKLIPSGQSGSIQVQNSDGSTSAAFTFFRN